jgi:DNA-binding NtrC family response regulator
VPYLQQTNYQSFTRLTQLSDAFYCIVYDTLLCVITIQFHIFKKAKPMTPAKILIVDDDTDVLETARMFLKQEFSTITLEEKPERILTHLESQDYDIVLLDMNFRKGVNDGEEGFYWLEQIKKADERVVVVLITAYGEVDLAVKAMKMGAVDFVTKPWKNQKLLATLQAALSIRQSRREIEKLKTTQEKLSVDLDQNFSEFIGSSAAIKRVHELIDRVAHTDADILILGENGTGKEVVARTIHKKSLRKSQVFITVDLGALSESLFESELFGYVKGAFTDAKQDKAGRFEIASGGTLFLDEIGNLSPALQAKLLTVLQQRKVQRLGSHKEINIDVRIISATNQELHEMVFAKTFRQDLLYRINTVEIRVPSLRERMEDLPALIDFFLRRYGQKYKRPGMRIEKGVMNKLMKYAWPGNIRELQHAVERAVILTDNKIISSAELLISNPLPRTRTEQANNFTMDEMEKQFILESLQRHEENVTNTAKALGMTRTALYRRRKKHNIKTIK